MKLAAIAKLVKADGYCKLYKVFYDDCRTYDLYIGTKTAIFPLTGFPKAQNESELATLLGISKKEWADIEFDNDCPDDLHHIEGMAKFYSDAKHNEFKTKEQRDNAFTVSIHRRNDMQDGLDNLYRRYVLPAPISDLMEIPYRAEQVWLVIRHALAWHDKPEGDWMNVEFDKPLNRSDQPQPTIKLTEVQDNTKPACDG